MGKMNIFDLKDLSEKEEVVRILTENENVNWTDYGLAGIR